MRGLRRPRHLIPVANPIPVSIPTSSPPSSSNLPNPAQQTRVLTVSPHSAKSKSRPLTARAPARNHNHNQVQELKGRTMSMSTFTASTAIASRLSVTTMTATTTPGMGSGRVPRTTVLTLAASTSAAPSGDARKKFGAPPTRPHPSSPSSASAPSPSQTSTPVVVAASPIPASTTRAARSASLSAPPNAPSALVLSEDASPSTHTHTTAPTATTTTTPTTFPPAPMPNAYWATPTLLACEYPWCPASASATASSNGAATTIVAPKLTALLRAGIRTFIDLTEPHELLPYSPLLPSLCLSLGIPPSSVAYYRFPTKDRTAPSASTLDNVLGLLARLKKGGVKAAVHCRGGAGRTGTVVALYLLESGYAYALSLEQVGDDDESRRRQRQLQQQQQRNRNQAGGNREALSRSKYNPEAKRAALAHVQRGWESTEKCVRLGYLRSPETEGQRRVVEGWEGVEAALAAEEAASAATTTTTTTTVVGAATAAAAAAAAAATAVAA